MWNSSLRLSIIFLDNSFFSDLFWKGHIISLFRKASKTLGLQRLFQNFLTLPTVACFLKECLSSLCEVGLENLVLWRLEIPFFPTHILLHSPISFWLSIYSINYSISNEQWCASPMSLPLRRVHEIFLSTQSYPSLYPILLQRN